MGVLELKFTPRWDLGAQALNLRTVQWVIWRCQDQDTRPQEGLSPSACPELWEGRAARGVYLCIPIAWAIT